MNTFFPLSFEMRMGDLLCREHTVWNCSRKSQPWNPSFFENFVCLIDRKKINVNISNRKDEKACSYFPHFWLLIWLNWKFSIIYFVLHFRTIAMVWQISSFFIHQYIICFDFSSQYKWLMYLSMNNLPLIFISAKKISLYFNLCINNQTLFFIPT